MLLRWFVFFGVVGFWRVVDVVLESCFCFFLVVLLFFVNWFVGVFVFVRMIVCFCFVFGEIKFGVWNGDVMVVMFYGLLGGIKWWF